MRFAFISALILSAAACTRSPSTSASSDCIVTVRPANGAPFTIPGRAEYCLYVPDSAACCQREGADCAALAAPAVFEVGSVERGPGCPKKK